MFQQYFGSRKTVLFILAGVVALALLLLVWRIISLQKAASEAAPVQVIKIGYCGAEPEELCVLSFGRDAEENMVVNLFVPDRKFPEFYLKIQRVAGENVYECEKDKEVRTSVFCYGNMVNLQEKMQVSLFAKSDERLLAAGDFILKAILVSESLAGVSGGTATTAPDLEETLTPTVISNTLIETDTPTPTITPSPDVSYPDSSYP